MRGYARGALLLAASAALATLPAAAQTLAPLHGLPLLRGDAPGAGLGLAHTVGDFDCDGLVDLAVSSADPPAVWIWSAMADPAAPWPGPTWADNLGVESADLLVRGTDPSFGSALTSGDLGGACDSLVVGAPADRAGAGAAYLLHGPLPTSCAGPCLVEAELSADVTFEGYALGALGSALVVAGDLDGIGHDDLVLSEPAYALPSGQNHGRALVYGRGLGNLSNTTLVSLNANVLIEGAPNQFVGLDLQAADVDADGTNELLIEGAGDVLLLHDLSGLTGVVQWSVLAADPTRHHGEILSATLPMGVHGPDQPLRALWVREPWWFLGVGGVVALLPDSQGRFDQSREQAAVRIEGRIGADGFLGATVDGGDVSGDGVGDLLISSPLWSDGDGTVVDSVGPRAGMHWLIDGNDLPALLEQVCVPPPCGFVVDSLATLGLRGTQGREGAGEGIGTEAITSSRVAAIGERIVVFSPLLDDPIYGLDAGGVRALAVDADDDGALLGQDCDDFDPTVFPGAEPVCDGVLDQDCDGTVDANQIDRDADGVTLCEGDCDDEDANRAPGLSERWCDGLDNDCISGPEDAAERDGDQDGFRPCEGDCDDGRSDRSPADPEQCNGEDDDCDGAIDEDFDADGDGFPNVADRACDGRPAQTLDCDDANPDRYPGASEGTAIVDSDCDGGVAWRGGFACDSADGDLPGVAWLLLLLFVGRRPRRTPAYAATLLLAAPLLMGQARLLPTTTADLVLVGEAGTDLPWTLVSTEVPRSIVLGEPFAPNFWANQGGVYILGEDVALPRLIQASDITHPVPSNLFARYAGFSLATGDIDGDGLDDVAIGTPGTGGILDSGEVTLMLGGGDCVPDGVFCPGKTFKPGVAYSVGSDLSFADLNGDGFDELLVGDAWGYEAQNLLAPQTSNLWVVWGRDDLSPGSDNWQVNRFWGAPGRLRGAVVRGDADWNCDGLPDLLVGCEPIAGGCADPELLLLLNTGDGFETSGPLLDLRPRLTLAGTQSSVDIAVRSVPDLGGDGCDDVLVGLPGQDEDSGAAAFISITPSTDLLDGSDDAVRSIDDIASWILVGGPDDRVGRSLALVRWTDPDAPYPDLLVGAPQAASGLTPQHRPGHVAFIRGGDAFGGGLVGRVPLVDAAAALMRGQQDGESVGHALTLGDDLDDDGERDILVAAPGLDHPDGGVDAGGLYVLRSALFRDLDGDGAAGLDDCDDTIPACIDAATDCIDSDGDGVVVCAGDCDDADPTVFPDRNPREVAERTDACTGTDDDCDGVLRDDELDADGDGVLACAGDCDDARAEIAPGFPELCNGLDDDCDGAIDEDHDADADAYPAGDDCAGLDGLDCDDRARETYPGAVDVPGDGRDQDCDGEDASAWIGGCACDSNGSRPLSPWLTLALLLGLGGAVSGRRCGPSASRSTGG